jgi:hypothetical protein
MSDTGPPVPLGKGVVVYDTMAESVPELIAGALRSAGIGASVIGGRIGEGGSPGRWQVVVHHDDVRDAREIIDVLEAEDRSP